MTSASTNASTVTVTVLAAQRSRRNRPRRGSGAAVLAGAPARRSGAASAARRRRRLARCGSRPSVADAPSGSALGDAGHQQADLLARRCPAGTIADDPAAVHHRDPVGQRRAPRPARWRREHGGAVVALGDDPLVDELDRADVEAAGRLGGDEQLQRPGQLPGEDDLLLVAAGQRADRRARCDGGADVELARPARRRCSAIASRSQRDAACANGGRS